MGLIYADLELVSAGDLELVRKGYINKEEIEHDFGGPLVWERLDTKRACRIKSEIKGNIFEEESWDELINEMVDRMVRMEAALKKPIRDVGRKLKNKR